MTSPLPPSWPSSGPVVLKAHGLHDLLAYAERVLGYRPVESLVVLGLHGQRSRVGAVACLGLPPQDDADAAEALAETTLRQLRQSRPDRAVAVVVSDAAASPGLPRPDDLPHARLARALQQHAGAAGPPLRDLDLVARGRRLSYTCDDECCPPAGVPLADTRDSAVTTAMVVQGCTVEGDRDQVVRRLRAAVAPADPSLRRRVERVARRPLDAAGRAAALEHWCAALAGATAAVLAGRDPDEVAAELLAPDAAGRLLAAMRHRPTRDGMAVAVVPGCGDAPEVLSGGGLDAHAAAVLDAVFGGPHPPAAPQPGTAADAGATAPDADLCAAAAALLRVLARRASGRRRADPLAVLALLTWWRGSTLRGGAHAELALQQDPRHSLAGLVLAACAGGLAPGWVTAPAAARGGAAGGG